MGKENPDTEAIHSIFSQRISFFSSFLLRVINSERRKKANEERVYFIVSITIRIEEIDTSTRRVTSERPYLSGRRSK